jgi:hypothetical protein
MGEKLCMKHTWDDETFDDIDWTSHGRGLRRHDKHKVTMVKYLNDILPLGKQVHRYNAKYPESCTSCPAPIEDREHFWRCPARSIQKWKAQCYKTIFTTLQDLDTAPPLQTLFLEALKAELDGRRPDSIQVPDNPIIQAVAQAQEAIGWHHILKGRFSMNGRASKTHTWAPKQQRGTTVNHG